MGESWLAGVHLAPWAPAVAAYLFGIASGWLIWGGRRSEGVGGAETATTEDNGATALSGDRKAGGKDAVPAAISEKLRAIQTEIDQARELLEKSEDGSESLADEIATIDEAIKRSNGRLKLLLRAVQRAGKDA